MASLSEHAAASPLREERSSRPAPLLRLLARARPYTTGLALALLLSLAFSGAIYLRAYLMKPILDDVVLPHGALVSERSSSPGGSFRDLLGGRDAPGADTAPLDGRRRAELEREIRESFARVLGLALVLILALPLLQFGRTYLVESVLGRVYIDLQQALCSQLLALPLRVHRDRRRGDLLSRALRDVSTAHGALGLLFGDFAEACLMVVVSSALLFYISWQLALTTLLLGPLIFVVVTRFGMRIRESARRRQETHGDVTQRLLEILSGIKVIKAFRAEAIEDAAYRRETHRLFRRSMKVVKNRVLARSLVEMMNNIVSMGLLLVGALLVLRGRWGLTAGDLAAFAAVMATSYRPLKSLAKGWVQLADAHPAAARFFEVLDVPAERREAPAAVRLEGVRRGVRFHRVAFSYGREPVLQDVSFEVAAGEMLALVGRTGAGKTTLADLLLRFHDPSAGSIEIDGLDLRCITRDSLLEHVAVVTQEPFLFDGTILDNVRYGRPGASDDEVRTAARAAFVDEFADRLPEGLDTEVGPEGARLSGGQRQRIAVARAMLKDPSILIFDEATNALDAKSERYIQEAIDAMRSGRTLFVIAHRLSTIRHADQIVVLDEGRVTQLGSHAELMQQEGLYRELVSLQSAMPIAADPDAER